MKIKEVIEYLENIAPLTYQESYDNSGLIIGDDSNEITGVLICLDSTEEVVEEAVLKKCNLIIAHHPIIFGGIKKINSQNYVGRTIVKAIKNNISIYACHTNLDNTKEGVNKKIADKLGLLNLSMLQPKPDTLKKLVVFVPKENAEILKKALFDAGAGEIGNYNNCSFTSTGIGTFKPLVGANPQVGTINKLHQSNEEKVEVVFQVPLQNEVVKAMLGSHPYEEVAYEIYTLSNTNRYIGSGMIGYLPHEIEEVAFLENVKKVMKANCIKHTQLLNKKVLKVAVCGGSGSFLLKNAIAQKADIFITSDFKYHEFFDAEKSIIIADIGHYESEQYTIELIGELLIKKFTTFAIRFTEINTNPVKYF
jgi:dinuclear metal center YbgI/SA1388 family protein